jgi:hypothetical protein
MADLSQYTLPNDTPVVVLDCQEAFDGLTDQEKLYAHYLAQASFAGGLIVLVQVCRNFFVWYCDYFYFHLVFSCCWLNVISGWRVIFGEC